MARDEPVDERVHAATARAVVQARVAVGAFGFTRHRSRVPSRGAARYSECNVPDGHADGPGRPGRGGGRSGVGGAAAARPARVRRPLRRHGAARPLGRAHRRVAGRGRGDPSRSTARVRRGLRQRRALAARARRRCAGRSPGWRSTSRPGPARRWSSACTRRAAICPCSGGPAGRSPRRAWRHVLFGFVLGELERRLNPAREAAEPLDDAVVSTNGHGSVEHLVTQGPAAL